jgi:hypothetical protein
MNRFLALLLMVGSLLAAVAVSATESANVPLGARDVEHSGANLSVSRTSPELTSISLQSPVIETQTQTVDYQTYQTFGIQGELYTQKEGDPTLPQVTRFYRIPNTGGADLVITNAEYDVVDNVNPLPVQPEGESFQSLRRNDALYTKDAWYPENVAEISDPMIMRDFRVVTVTLYPVQVNPVTHQARIYRNLSVDVVANNRPGTNELLNPRRPSGEWAPIYRSMISNLDDNALDNVTTTPGSYMIITNTNTAVKPFADSLAEWKTRKGYKVIVSAQSSWTSDQVYNAIYAAYQNSDPPLEFVCLMGDPGVSWGIPVDGQWGFDHRYANMTPGDNIEDIGVGRLSGGSQSTMATINAKIMQYERTPRMLNGGAADTTWFHKSFLYAGTARSVSSNYLIMRWAKDQFTRHTGVYLDSVQTHSGDNIVNSDVTNQINAGIGYFLWRGTWVGGMSSTIADATTPGGRLPITMTITCMAGEYTGSGVNSPAEDFLCAGTPTNPAGGVCGMGTSTDGTENGANGILASGMVYAIADAQVEHLGTAVASAKAQLYSAYGPNLMDTSPYTPSGPIAQNFTHWFNLLGDPGLAMWTDVPESLSVTCPATLNIGARSVDVTVVRRADGVPMENALVCLWKKSPDSTWVRGTTDAQGHITFPVSINTAGSMYVTVTKRNCVPYLYTIPCSQAAVMPMVSSYTLDDDNVGGTQGNGNGVMNPGEVIDLPVYIRNFGSSVTATGISASLTSTDPHVVVTAGSATYPNLAPGDSALGSIPFRIQVSSGMQYQETALLTLTINAASGQTVGTVPLTCQAGAALYMGQHLGSVFDPGTSTTLQVVVKNTGSMPMNGVSGHLTSLSPFVSVGDPNAVFGDIAVGALDSNVADNFSLTSAAVTYRGHQAPMLLVLTTSAGFSDTVQFIVTVGTAQPTDPTGPDVYGYFAYDNSDAGYLYHPTFSYVDISSSGGTLMSAPSSDPGEKTSYTADYSAAHRLPFTFKYYGQRYDTITVCSNGWCAFGNQSYLDMFRHYQIPAMGTPDAMIAPYFGDLKTTGTGRGVWVMDDSPNHRCIIQWKAFGWAASCTPEDGTAGANFTVPLDFEVILYDTAYTPTVDGNGEVLVQYNQVSMNLNAEYCDEPAGCTIGIQEPGNLIGLQYAYQAAYSPGAATVQNGRAILFTTQNALGQLTPTLTVTSPNGGEQWYTGHSQNVTWSSISVPGNVTISLKRNYPSGSWETLFSHTANTGSIPWIVTGPAVSNTARIRIVSDSLPTIGDTSNASFSILASSFTLNSPNGGELLVPGSVAHVTWTYNPPDLGTARVEINRSYPSSNWELLSESTLGAFDWTVTGPTTNTARIRATATLAPAVGDTSDGNFIIGQPPTIVHTPHADANLGALVFVAKVMDDAPGVTTKLFNRLIGAVAFDSLALTPTGFTNEYAVTTPALTAGEYEYYLRATDAQFLSTVSPSSGTYHFKVGAVGSSWIAYDDSAAENYNWENVSRPYKWAVKFDPGTYPFVLTAGRFAICPTNPPGIHAPIVFEVWMADGTGGMPGTLVYQDTAGCAGNIIGGLPAGAAWADVVTRTNNQPLQLNGPFYLSVMNQTETASPAAFATDTSLTPRYHQSYLWDDCEGAWYNEDAGQTNNRPGDRMIRAEGFPLTALTVVIYKVDSANVSSSVLSWTSNGAPYYHIYTATNVSGPYDTLVGSMPGPASGQRASFTDYNAINLGTRRFYKVVSADAP